MNIPINSFKFFGIELDIYKHQRNPSEEDCLQNFCHDGYLEIVITITPDNFFINPEEYRVLIISAVDGRQTFKNEGNVFALTLSPLERYIGVHHRVDYSFTSAGADGADLIDIFTKPLNVPERQETLIIHHSKGLVIPQSMLLN